MAGKERKKANLSARDDIIRLRDIRDKMWPVQAYRIEKKYPERGTFTTTPVEDVLINLNRNIGQFNVALCERRLNAEFNHDAYEKATAKAIQQAGDIINLVEITLHNLHITDAEFDLAIDLKRSV